MTVLITRCSGVFFIGYWKRAVGLGAFGLRHLLPVHSWPFSHLGQSYQTPIVREVNHLFCHITEKLRGRKNRRNNCKNGLKLNLRKVCGSHYPLLSTLRNTEMIRLDFVAVNYLYIKTLSYLYYDYHSIFSLWIFMFWWRNSNISLACLITLHWSCYNAGSMRHIAILQLENFWIPKCIWS